MSCVFIKKIALRATRNYAKEEKKMREIDRKKTETGLRAIVWVALKGLSSASYLSDNWSDAIATIMRRQ